MAGADGYGSIRRKGRQLGVGRSVRRRLLLLLPTHRTTDRPGLKSRPELILCRNARGEYGTSCDRRGQGSQPWQRSQISLASPRQQYYRILKVSVQHVLDISSPARPPPTTSRSRRAGERRRRGRLRKAAAAAGGAPLAEEIRE